MAFRDAGGFNVFKSRPSHASINDAFSNTMGTGVGRNEGEKDGDTLGNSIRLKS